MASAACELIWLKSLLLDMGFSSSLPMTLFCDNQAAMHVAANPMFHERSKHIEIDCHFIRQQVQLQAMKTCYSRSQDQLVDVFTKVLASTHFHRLLSKLGSINPLAICHVREAILQILLQILPLQLLFILVGIVM